MPKHLCFLRVTIAFFFWNFKITNFQTSNVMIHGRKKREEAGIEELNEEVIIVKEY